MPDDPRYHTALWRRTAKAVLRRDGYVCRIVEGCPRPATVADHIVEVTPDLPNAMFFGMGNLRAGCDPHNRARSVIAKVTVPGASDVVTSDYTKAIA